jgi:Tannase and feruloyl esterase
MQGMCGLERMNRSATLSACVVLAGWAQVYAYTGQPSATQCSSLLAMQVENATLTEATFVPPDKPFTLTNPFGPPVIVTSLPEHCLVHGEVNHHKGADGKDYGDKFEVRIPVDWQGRLLFLDGAGLDGLLSPAIGFQGPTTKTDSKSALGMGYAVVTTDGGHQAIGGVPIDGSFGSDPEARTDYNYRSTRLVTDVARKIIAGFYGRSIQHSYFMGCSNGGREGLKAALRIVGGIVRSASHRCRWTVDSE